VSNLNAVAAQSVRADIAQIDEWQMRGWGKRPSV
jgi:hypothetical protein